MRFLLFILVAFSIQAQAIEQDKVKHFSVSYALSSTGLFALPKNIKWLAPVFTLAIGAAKELTDSRFDTADMLANSVGVGSSIVVLELD